LSGGEILKFVCHLFIYALPFGIQILRGEGLVQLTGLPCNMCVPFPIQDMNSQRPLSCYFVIDKPPLFGY
jgi:hypothetical protein